MKTAIIGTGKIAGHMAAALNGLQGEVPAYAVASRNLEKAREFAREWHFEKAYGSYEELVEDAEVDLVYVATPHAMHYENTKLCLEHGKNVLVEKAFTANRKQAIELVGLAREKSLLLAEAMWTRYMPGRKMVEDLLEQGAIGMPTLLEADFSVPISHIERLHSPELAGGALLDLGVYTLTFASMFFGDEMESVQTTCEKYDTEVDATDHMILKYPDGRKAVLRTSMVEGPVNEGKIVGTKGYLRVENLNNFSKIESYDLEGNLKETYYPPKQINGYEYEVLACKRALSEGKTECPEMPLEETLRIMGWMDSLRKKWGVIYPFEKEEDLGY